MMTRRQFLCSTPLLAAGVRSSLRAAADQATGDIAPIAYHGAHLHNIAAVEPTNDGLRLCRIRPELWAKVNHSAQVRSYSPAGSEVRFNLRGPKASIWVKYVQDLGNWDNCAVLADIYRGDFLERSVAVHKDWTEISVGPLPQAAAMAAETPPGARAFDSELVRIMLPILPEVRLLRIEGEIAPPRPDQVPRRRYLAYGSSITNGAMAARPGDTYPARVARALRTDVWNVGFGGGAHLEHEMADWIAERDDWEFASLELGINVLGAISPEEFRRRVQYFVPRIAKRHPDKPLFVIDLFTIGARGRRGYENQNLFRQAVRETAEGLRSDNVIHLDGRRLLPDPAGLTLDQIHPSSEGYAQIAANLVSAMRRRLPAS